MSHAGMLAELKGKIGQTLRVSDWMEIEQARIDAFAEATGDFQWIHIDAERASRESPYGTTIAHGYLTLSLYPLLRQLVDADAPAYPGVKNVINYGLNKVRFPNAVRVGSRIRGHFKLHDVAEVAGGLQIVEIYTVEVEGQEKPACIAEAIMRLYL